MWVYTRAWCTDMCACVRENMQVSWLSCCILRYTVIENRRITNGTDLCVHMNRKPLAGCHPSRLMSNKCIHNHTRSDTRAPDLSAQLLGRKMHRGLLSHLQLWHNSYTACRCMQSNLFLPILIFSAGWWKKETIFFFLTGNSTKKAEAYLQWHTGRAGATGGGKVCADQSLDPDCSMRCGVTTRK